MNFSDLFVVVALATALYGLIAALAGRGHFLTRAVNPHRGTWVATALSVLWVGISLLRWEAGSWNLSTWGSLLSQLVTDDAAPMRVKIASLAIFLSVVFLVLVARCYLFLPRDPSTFSRPADRRKAFKYYVSRLKGGVDYALLACGDGERLEEEADLNQIQRHCEHLPKVVLDGSEPRLRRAEEQVQFWRDMATQLHARMGELDSLIEVAHHGRNRRLVFDAEYGGFFFRYLRLTDVRSKLDTSLYLFAATVNQAELDNQRAEHHFHLLLQALQHIDRSIRVG